MGVVWCGVAYNIRVACDIRVGCVCGYLDHAFPEGRHGSRREGFAAALSGRE